MGKEQLQPWEEKIIGRKDRYSDGFFWNIANAFWSMGETGFNYGMNYLFDTLSKGLNPDIHKYELYGKKVDRPWGVGWGALYSVLDPLLTNQWMKEKVSNSLKRSLYDRKQVLYSSGQQVADSCFLQSYLNVEGSRPPICFDETLMVEFYNELGVVPDESIMIGDLYAETAKIKDSNFTDEMWRTYVMPVIISEGYKKSLNTVYGILHEEYMDNPAISREKLEERMDKAQVLLGRLYQNLSEKIANYSDYLEAPLTLMTSDKKAALSAAPEQALTKEEQQKFDNYQVHGLVSLSEIRNFKKLALKTTRPEEAKDFVQAFYRSVTGCVGKESERTVKYQPKKLQNENGEHDRFNDCCFINAVASLKGFQTSIAKSSDKRDQEALDLMKENLVSNYALSEQEIQEIMNPGVSVEELEKYFQIEVQSLFGYEKRKVPEKEPDNAAQSYYEMIEKQVKRGISYMTDALDTGKAIVTEGVQIGKQIVTEGTKMVTGTAKTTWDIFSGNIIGDIDVTFEEDDLYGGLGEDKTEEIREYSRKKQEEEARQKQELEERLKKEQERIKRIEENVRRAKEEARKAEERNKLLANLEPWQKKVIGYQTRYSDSWMGAMLQGISKNYGDAIDRGVDNLFSYLEKSINPEVTRYEVFGKKLDRPWSRLESIPGKLLGPIVSSSTVTSPIKTMIRRAMLTPGIDQYVSGETVALNCFAPTFIQGQKRPPCHFGNKQMAEFYNVTGIKPDEYAIVSDMMEETKKIADANYTDRQWRTKLMPMILQGSFKKQLTNVFKQIQEEYQKNPAITEKTFKERIQAASNALGEMYCDFSKRIANTTEYLEAPVQFFEYAKENEFPEEIMSSLNGEQKELAKNVKPQLLIQKSELNAMIQKASSFERPLQTAGSLLEEFYKATSGYVGKVDNYTNYTPKPFNAQHRDMQNERCMISAIATAKKMAELVNNAKKMGFFSRLFSKKTNISENQLCLNAMKESLGVYGFSKNQINSMLSPEKTIESVKQELGIDDKTILGIREIDVSELEKVSEEKGYIDYARDFYKKNLELVTNVIIGSYNLVKDGAKFIVSKSSDYVYSKFNNGQPGKESEQEKVAEVEEKEEKKLEAILPKDSRSEGTDLKEDEMYADEFDEEIVRTFQESENKEYENQGFWAWGLSWFKGGYTKPAAIDEIYMKQDQVMEQLAENVQSIEKPEIYKELAKIEYLTTLQRAVEFEQLTPDSAIKGISEQRMSKDVEKLAMSQKFKNACDRMLETKKLEEQIKDNSFPEKLHKVFILKVRETKKMNTAKKDMRADPKKTTIMKLI